MESKAPKSLKKSSEFLEIKSAGSRYLASSWLLFGFKKNSSTHLKFGITASRKVGPAVIRNRLKRMVREYIRVNMSAEKSIGADINIIFRPTTEGFYKGLQFDELKKTLDKGFEYIRKNA